MREILKTVATRISAGLKQIAQKPELLTEAAAPELWLVNDLSGLEAGTPSAQVVGRRVRLGRPKSGYRNGEDSVTHFKRAWPGVQDHPPEEPLAQLVAKPEEVPGVFPFGCGVGLDLDSDDLAAGVLDEQIDLVTPLLPGL